MSGLRGGLPVVGYVIIAEGVLDAGAGAGVFKRASKRYVGVGLSV